MSSRTFAVRRAVLRLCAALSAGFGLPLGVVAFPAFAVPAYSIVSEAPAADGVRVSVRLDARQTAGDLKVIADDVRKRLPAAKAVRSVAFYLPSTALTANAWADVKIAQDATVTVHGLRLEEEDAYRAEASADKRNRIGVWLTSPPALAGRLTLYRDGKGKTLAEWQLRSGQTTTDEVSESRANGGRRFDIKGGDGGYYRLTGNGFLELGNAGSVIAVAEPLKLSPPKPAAVAPTAVSPATVSPAAPAVAAAPMPASQAPASQAPASQAPASQANEAVTAAANGNSGKIEATKAEPSAKPARKRTAARPRSPDRPTRQADAAGDAIKRALAQ